MNKELNPQQLAARNRMMTLIEGENGEPYSTDCPAKNHGSYGYKYWGCRCEPCKAGNRAASAEAYKRRKHNSLLIMQMRNKTSEGAAEADLPSAEAPTTPEVEQPDAAPPSLAEFAEIYRALFYKGA